MGYNYVSCLNKRCAHSFNMVVANAVKIVASQQHGQGNVSAGPENGRTYECIAVKTRSGAAPRPLPDVSFVVQIPRQKDTSMVKPHRRPSCFAALWLQNDKLHLTGSGREPISLDTSRENADPMRQCQVTFKKVFHCTIRVPTGSSQEIVDEGVAGPGLE